MEAIVNILMDDLDFILGYLERWDYTLEEWFYANDLPF